MALAGLFVLTGLALRAVLPLNPDLIWLAHLASQRVAGVDVYRHFVELNPPTAWWVHLPAVAATSAFGTPLVMATHIQTVCLVLALTLAVSALTPRPFRVEVAPWLAFAALLLPGLQFGQRDHLVGLLFVPAALGLVQAGRTETSSRRRDVVIGALLGLACGFKPHYLPAAIFVLAAGGIGRSGSGWNRAGLMAMTLVVAVLTAAALVLEPAYLRVVADYGALYSSWHRAGLLDYLKPIALLAVAVSLALSESGNGRLIVLLWLLLAGAVLQGKGFAYHFLPAAVVSIVLLPLALRPERVRRAFPVAVVALLALWSLGADGANLVNRRRAWTEDAMGGIPAGTSVLILTHVVGSSWPVVLERRWIWTSSYASSWWLESIIQRHGGKWCSEERVDAGDLGADERHALERAVTDFITSSPEVILTYRPVRNSDGTCVGKQPWYQRENDVLSYQVGALDVLATDLCARMLLSEYAESTGPETAWLVLRRLTPPSPTARSHPDSPACRT